MERPEPAAPPPRRAGLATNATWRLAGIVFRVAVGLISVPIFTRLLGMSQWGLLALFQAATSPMALLEMGLGTATIKYVAEAIGRGDRKDAARVVHTTLLFNLAVAGTGAMAMLALAPWFAGSLFAIPPGDVHRAVIGFRVTAGTWAVNVLAATFLGVVSAHQRYDKVSKLTTLGTAGSVGCGLVVAAVTRDIVWVTVTQLLAAAAVSVLWFRTATDLLPGIVSLPRWHRGAFHRSFSFGLWQAIAVAGGLLTGYADRYILGVFFTPATVGVYAVVNLLFAQLYSTFGEMGEVLFPAVSEREGRGEMGEARRLALIVGWTLSTGLGVAMTVLAVVGSDFLCLWISPDVAREATVTLRVLCVAGIVAMPAVGPFYFLLGIGKTRWDAAASIITGIAVLILGLILVPRYGLAGVGYGIIAGAAARWVILAFVWHLHFASTVRFGNFAADVWSPPFISLAILFAATTVHDRVARTPSWAWLAVEILALLGLVGVLQIGVGELLPEGSRRRRDVVNSFRPLIVRFVGWLT